MAMSDGIRVGLFFGTTSGVITTCGLLTGLAAGTRSLPAVLGGILVIAVADSLSDALGIHLAEESAPGSHQRHVWVATLSTFLAKLLVSASFAVPVALLPLARGVPAALLWGALLLTLLSWQLARIQAKPPLPIILEHLLIGVIVIGLSHGVGLLVHQVLGSAAG